MADVLKDPALLGKFYAYKTKVVRDSKGKRKVDTIPEDWLLVYEDPTQAILTTEQFYALKEKSRRNKENSFRHAKHYYPPLRSLVFCKCGRRMVGVYRNRKPWYRCLNCGRWIRALPLWNEVKQGLKKMLLQPERLIPAVQAQFDSEKSIDGLEQDLRANRQQLQMLEKAEQKALRLHLYLPNYPFEKLEMELQRIQQQRHGLTTECRTLERQIMDLQQAMVNEEGVRRFCQIATRNLDTIDDSQWRVLLETMRLRLIFDGKEFHAKIALPTVQEEKSVIVLCTSRSGGR